jgi:hypothetical protein
MGSITRSFANNIGSSGILTASAVTNTTVEDVTSFDNAASSATLVLLSTQTASASATISFTTGLDSTYDEYIFKFINVRPTDNFKLLTFNMSTDGGSNYNVTKTTTLFRAIQNEAGDDTTLAYETGFDLAQSTGFAQLTGTYIGNGADESTSGELTIYNPSSSTFVKHFICRSNTYDSDDYSVDGFIAGYGNTTSAVNAVQFKMNTGNIDDGIIKLYGVKKS